MNHCNKIISLFLSFAIIICCLSTVGFAASSGFTAWNPSDFEPLNEVTLDNGSVIQVPGRFARGGSVGGTSGFLIVHVNSFGNQYYIYSFTDLTGVQDGYNTDFTLWDGSYSRDTESWTWSYQYFEDTQLNILGQGSIVYSTFTYDFSLITTSKKEVVNIPGVLSRSHYFVVDPYDSALNDTLYIYAVDETTDLSGSEPTNYTLWTGSYKVPIDYTDRAELPNYIEVPSDWDSVKYPYAVLYYSSSSDDPGLCFRASSSPFYMMTSKWTMYYANSVCWNTSDFQNWNYLNSNSYTSSNYFASTRTLLWSNYDIRQNDSNKTLFYGSSNVVYTWSSTSVLNTPLDYASVGEVVHTTFNFDIVDQSTVVLDNGTPILIPSKLSNAAGFIVLESLGDALHSGVASNYNAFSFDSIDGVYEGACVDYSRWFSNYRFGSISVDGVALPPIPCFDYSLFPYVTVIFNGTSYTLRCTQFPFTVDTDDGHPISGGYGAHSIFDYIPTLGIWMPSSYSTAGTSSFGTAYKVVWANYPVYKSSGATYYSGSSLPIVDMSWSFRSYEETTLYVFSQGDIVYSSFDYLEADGDLGHGGSSGGSSGGATSEEVKGFWDKLMAKLEEILKAIKGIGGTDLSISIENNTIIDAADKEPFDPEVYKGVVKTLRNSVKLFTGFFGFIYDGVNNFIDFLTDTSSEFYGIFHVNGMG